LLLIVSTHSSWINQINTKSCDTHQTMSFSAACLATPQSAYPFFEKSSPRQSRDETSVANLRDTTPGPLRPNTPYSLSLYKVAAEEPWAAAMVGCWA
jgi:hypothetical protein